MTPQEPNVPRGFLEEYYPEEFDDMLDKLNALNPSAFPWQRTKARKEHKVLFGETIQDSEVYFKRQVGTGRGDDIKLSWLSMERMLYALFSLNPGLEGLAEEIYKARQEKRREAHRRYSPLSAPFRADGSEDAE
jgi:hypothetical protein